MIFKPILIEQIVNGRKTVTRRPVKSDRCQYEPGKEYSIQPGMARPGVARIRVLNVRQEDLGDLTNDDAEREGFLGGPHTLARQVFQDYWIDLYGAWTDWTQVWRIEFELVEQTHASCFNCDGAGYLPVEVYANA